MAQRAIITNGYKTVSATNLDTDVGWNVISGPRNEERVTDATLYRRVPWLKRGMDCIGDAVAGMPFVILKDGKEADNSKDYKNAVGFMPDPRTLFAKVAVSLTMLNQAYLRKARNGFKYVKKLNYCRPDSLTIVYDKEKGNRFIGFDRGGNNLAKQEFRIDTTSDDPYKDFDIVFFWRSDMYTEVGPTPEASPAQAAIAAAGVLYHKDKFVASYFERGAIRVTILATDTNDKSEAERLKNWWQDVVAGVKNAWTAFVVRAKQIVPTVIGGGLDELKENGLTQQAREDISTALGIPQSKLFSSSATGLGGGGVKDADDVQFYRETIIPLCWIMQDVLNEQLFQPEGYQLKFTPEALDVFAPDRVAQAQSMKTFNDWLTTCPSKEIAIATAAQYNFALTPELTSAIEAWFTQKEERAAVMVENFNKPKDKPADNQQQEQPGAQQEPPQNEQPKAVDPLAARAILGAWKRRACNGIERKHGPMVDFDAVGLPEDMQAAVRAGLRECDTKEQVQRLFDDITPLDPARAMEDARATLERIAALN